MVGDICSNVNKFNIVNNVGGVKMRDLFWHIFSVLFDSQYRSKWWKGEIKYKALDKEDKK